MLLLGECLGVCLACSKLINFIYVIIIKKNLLELRSAHFVAMFNSLSVFSFSVVEDHPGYNPANHQASYSQNSSCPGWHRIVGAICGERGARCNCGGYGSCRDFRATVYSCKNEGMLLKKIRSKSLIEYHVWAIVLFKTVVSIDYLLTFVGQLILLRSYVKLL